MTTAPRSTQRQPWKPQWPSVSFAAPRRATALAEWALLPLRLFLGVTFAFAGLQKLANPNFFRAASPISIQSQLAGAARFSPIHSLLHALIPYAGLIGMVIAYGELAVGLGTLLGFCSRIAAVGGALVSFNLFLAVSFHASPYFTGADIVFFFAWLPLVITPGGRQLSLDGYIERLIRAKQGVPAPDLVALPFAQVQVLCGNFSEGNCSALHGASCAAAQCPVLLGSAAPIATPVDIASVARRKVVVTGATAASLGAVALITGGATAAVGKMIGNAPTTSGTSSSVGTTGSTTGTTSGATGTVAGTYVGHASQVALGTAATLTLPGNGDPGIIIHETDGTWKCFDAVCPHAGCSVGWNPGSDVLVCPCHGSQFNLNTGAVLSGPAPTGLIEHTVTEKDGKLYVQ